MILEDHHKKTRVEWLERYRDNDFNNVVFADEVDIYGGIKSHRQWRKVDKKIESTKKRCGKNSIYGANFHERGKRI